MKFYVQYSYLSYFIECSCLTNTIFYSFFRCSAKPGNEIVMDDAFENDKRHKQRNELSAQYEHCAQRSQHEQLFRERSLYFLFSKTIVFTKQNTWKKFKTFCYLNPTERHCSSC